MSRTYRLSDFQALLREQSDTSASRRSDRSDRLQWDRSRESSPIERQNRDRTNTDRDNSDRFRTTYRHRNREYSLRESEVKTLIEVSKFRAIPADDLARLGCSGDRSRMESDVQNLRRQGLVEQRGIEGHESYAKQVFTLTKEAHKLLSEQNLIPNRQAIYHGFVKAKEARHDADLYRLYHKVAKEIDRVDDKVRRVVLDYELKRELYRKLSRVHPDKDAVYERIRLASEYDLKVVNRKIVVPDLRIEYEDQCRDIQRLDLEIATRDYRPHGLAEKAKAGFHLFAKPQDHPKLRRVLDTHEITAEIFAL